MIAMAEKGALFDPGPCMYMEKLAVGPSVNPHMVSLLYPIERNLKVHVVESMQASACWGFECLSALLESRQIAGVVR